jgi:hypothetical protein
MWRRDRFIISQRPSDADLLLDQDLAVSILQRDVDARLVVRQKVSEAIPAMTGLHACERLEGGRTSGRKLGYEKVRQRGWD